LFTHLKDDINIRKWSVIGAGSVLINNAEENSMYVGIPGKIIKKF